MELRKGHAVCFPYPAQGHINPMLKVAKLLHSRGFHVTFVNSEYNEARRARSTAGPGDGSGPGGFRFEAVPDGLPGPVDPDAARNSSAVFRSANAGCAGPFRALLARLGAEGGPPVTCVVSDAYMYSTLEVARELGLPSVVVFPAGACTLLCYAHYEKLVQMGIVPFKDNSYRTNGELDKVLDWVPGAEGIRLRDFPTFMRTTDPNDFVLNYVISMMNAIKKSSGILLNSFDALEHDALHSLSSSLGFPPLHAVGPLDLVPAPETTSSSIKSSLWEEDSGCLAWLDSRGPSTVVYVNFGSILVASNDQLAEFAWGLADSGRPFLWVLREGSAALPRGFLEEVGGRGTVAGWCDQERVLAHPAVGAFLTHNGWNSTMESLYNGVPMICWPFISDNVTNAWYCCAKWGVGVRIDPRARRAEVEARVREVLEGERGREMRERAVEWKRLAREATRATSGSSYSNLESVVKVLLSQS